jgi:ribonuclease-3
MGKAEMEAGLQKLPSVVSCAFEAIVGAIYVDQGYEKAQEFVQAVLQDFLDEALTLGPGPEDAKSRLQIFTQEEHRELPSYGTIAEEGPDHQKTFTVIVSLGNRRLGTGKGRSKKEAEQKAAAAALELLGADKDKG